MTTTTTIGDVRRMAAKVGELFRQVHADDDDSALNYFPVLDEGAPTYGRAYRLHVVEIGHSGHLGVHRWVSMLDCGGYLGWTKAEAHETLRRIMWHLYDMADAKGVAIDSERVDSVADQAERTKRADWSLWSDVAPWKMEKVDR